MQLFIQKNNFIRIIMLISLIFYGNKVYVIVLSLHLSLYLCFLPQWLLSRNLDSKVGRN